MTLDAIVSAIGVEPYYVDPDGDGVIFCGDCRDILPRMPGGCVDLVLTDPPFFTPAAHYQSRVSWGRSWGDLSILGQFLFDIAKDFKRILNPLGNCLVFCHDESYPIFYPGFYGLWTFTAGLIWDKIECGLGKIFRHRYEMILWASDSGAFVGNDGHLHTDILSYRATPSLERSHPVEKPIPLLMELDIVCCPKGGMILDCFLGSGTTAVAAKKLRRRYIGIEINPDYCAIAVRRLKNLQPEFQFQEAK